MWKLQYLTCSILLQKAHEDCSLLENSGNARSWTNCLSVFSKMICYQQTLYLLIYLHQASSFQLRPVEITKMCKQNWSITLLFMFLYNEFSENWKPLIFNSCNVCSRRAPEFRHSSRKGAKIQGLHPSRVCTLHISLVGCDQCGG